MITKPPKIVSQKIRDSAENQPCTLRVGGCHGKGTTVFAHLNTKWKGIGNKSPDLFGVYACYNCHNKLDSGQVSAKDQLRALTETQMLLYKQGLIEVK